MLFDTSTSLVLVGSPLITLFTVTTPTPSLSTPMLALASSTWVASPSITVLPSAPTTVPPAPTTAAQPSMNAIIPVAAALLGTLVICRRRKENKTGEADGNNRTQNGQEEISFKTFESGKLPTSRREQATYRTEDGVSVQYDVPRHTELFASNELRHPGSTSRGSPSLTVDSIGPCSIAPQSPEPQSEAHSSINPHSNLQKAITTEGFYDNPTELEHRPKLYYTLEDPDKHPPRPQNPLSQTLDQTGSSIDETKQKTNIYHVLETTERDPETGNRYHILEEQMRAQVDQSPNMESTCPMLGCEAEGKDLKAWWLKEMVSASKHRFREILREDIIVSDELGSGAFGTVYKAQWNFPGGKLGVAVKVMKPSIAQGQRSSSSRMAAVMGQFFHPNVVKLHGVVTVGEPPMIVLELMPRGDLSSFLRNYHTK
eukprot:Em0020g1046a